MQLQTLTLLWLAGVVLPTLVSSEAVEYSYTIYVDPDNGTNTTSCWTSDSPTQPCRNLSYALQYRNNSTRYVLQQATHYLDSTASDQPFRELNSVAITGNGNNVSVVCLEDAGLAFVSVENLFVANVTFSNCSAVQNSTSANFSLPNVDFELSLTRAAAYFSHCSNISFHNVTVTHSPGATGVIMYNTIGDNTFSGCTFSNNNNSNPLVYPGGGGVYVEFSYCLPGNTSCKNGTEESYTDHNKHSVYQFNDCVFFNNLATSGTNISAFITPYRQNHLAFSRGGGLSIFFNANSFNNTVNITKCAFVGNEAQWGAGLFAEFHDTSGGNRVFVNQSHIEENSCSGTAGGGMRVGHYIYNEVTGQVGNLVLLNNLKFRENQADNGGGLSVSITRQLAPSSQLLNLTIQGTKFRRNWGKYGAAVKVDLYSLILKGLKPIITINNCTIVSNSVYLRAYTKPEEIRIGAVYIHQVNVHFENSVLFKENNGSALAVVAAMVYVTNCSATFEFNFGTTGGAIALLGSSIIVVNESSVLKFYFNVATTSGGAIYNRYTAQDPQAVISNCFFAHVNPYLDPNDWNATVTFYGNGDSTGSNAIYSSSVLPCARAGGRGEENIDNVLCWRNWTYKGDEDPNAVCKNYIRTGSGSFELGSNSSANATPIYDAYPGVVVHLPINVKDDFGRNITVTYSATSADIFSNNSYVIAPDYAYVSQNAIEVYEVNGNSNNIFTVGLNTIGDRSWFVEVNLSVHDCPPGLVPTRVGCHIRSILFSHNTCISCQCVQKTHSYGEMVSCNSLSNASLASGYWMGRLCDKCPFLVAECPPGYCTTGKEDFMPLPSTHLDGHICQHQHRTGTLCGKCIADYGPALNSDTYDCVPCKISWKTLAEHVIYYILSVYLPLTVLTVVIIMFSIKLTTGPANAFILYSQVISSTFALGAGGRIPLGTFTSHPHAFEDAYKFPYGIFNLEFFERFVSPEDLCFGTHLNTLDVMLLDYIVAFFPLAMILVVVIIYNLKERCCKRCTCRLARPSYRIGDALMPAFATFIGLSYTKFSLTSTYLCMSRDFYGANDDTSQSHVYRHSYYAGHFSIHDPKFILYYYLPAIFVFLTFVAIPPLVLLDYPLRLFEKALSKVPWLWRRYPKSKIHILLDAFQGCYKNKWRCFAGLYFIFRLLINVTSFAHPLLQFTLQGIYCVLYALLVAFLKPYREQYHLFNYIDSLMFFNLAVVNQLSFYIYSYARNGSTAGLGVVLIIQYILVFLPLVYMIGYVIWSILPIPKLRGRARTWLADRSRQSQRLQGLLTSDQSEASAEVDWERAKENIIIYRPAPLESEGREEEGSTDSGLPSKKSSGSGSANYGSTGESARAEFGTNTTHTD